MLQFQYLLGIIFLHVFRLEASTEDRNDRIRHESIALPALEDRNQVAIDRGKYGMDWDELLPQLKGQSRFHVETY